MEIPYGCGCQKMEPEFKPIFFDRDDEGYSMEVGLTYTLVTSLHNGGRIKAKYTDEQGAWRLAATPNTHCFKDAGYLYGVTESYFNVEVVGDCLVEFIQDSDETGLR